ncbi:MAG: lipid A export permease/ATP-binding protein MsbA [Gammaproteobacteria bacterium]
MRQTHSTSPSSINQDGIKVYRRLLTYVAPYWKLFLLAVAGMAVYASTDASFAAIMKPMMDSSFVEKDPQTIKWVPILILGIFIGRAISGFFASFFMEWVARSVIRDLRKIMFTQLLQLPIRFYDTNSSGILLSKLLYDVEQLAHASSVVITILIRDSLTILFLLGLMFYTSVTLSLVFLVIAPFITIMVVLISKRFRKLSRRIQGSVGDVSHIAQETIEANREIKIFGGQQHESSLFDETNDYNRRQHLKLAATNAISAPFLQFLVAAAFSVIVYMATLPEMREAISPGTFVSFMTAMVLLMQPVKRLTTINASLQQGIAAAQSVFDFVDQAQEKDTGLKVLERVHGEVAFHDVSFAYNPENDNVLQNINLTIAPGQTVAFVGRSGAGKTTLVSLLPRFYDASSGVITLDGQDIREVSLQSLRSQIALVSQHVTLFNASIAHNIAYGALETATEADIERAARAAHAWDFIAKMPEGLNTMVGENGVMLSGGQRQRLAIARAILKDAPVLILDEATSALDSESERNIQAALEVLMQDRTTLVIAHRLSTIEHADVIVVMDEGRIVETGRHQELLDRRGRYAQLHNVQFKE